MLFNSFEFLVFLPIVFTLYWFVFKSNLKIQNALVLCASYVFYGWWDWRFLSIIALSTVLDFSIGRALSTCTNFKRRKYLLFLSLFFNLGTLGVFKYYNFFVTSFQDLLDSFGLESNPFLLKIILPVGISFYTFQTLSYTIDVYKKQLKPTTDFIAFAAFVSFFPQLVAGPIERASALLPQFYKHRVFNYELAKDGMRQVLWGLFKKIVIADNCAVFVNYVFENPDIHSSYSLFLAAVSFSFQIYGDFSGYSDIAIGVAKLFGFQLMRNFAYPYFSRDIAEFWRRWHISLSSWFRDYVYIPLGGSKGSKHQQIFNVFAIFLLSGFWHGANWTFIVWGGYHAILFLPLILTQRNRKYLEIAGLSSLFPSFSELLRILGTFILTMIGWIIFRAESLSDATDFIIQMFSFNSASVAFMKTNYSSLSYCFILCTVEWLGRMHEIPLNSQMLKNTFVRWLTYYAIFLTILLNLSPAQDFIYFQF